MTELILDSLQRRMATMHGLYYQAVGSMELEHVNHFEREGVLPIAFSLFHYTNMEDASFMMITGIPPVWNDDWQARVQMTVNDHGKHRTVDDTPYGGGHGMVMKIEPLVTALEAISPPGAHRVLFSARGHRFTQAVAHRLADLPSLVLVCGRYEGVDERITDLYMAASLLHVSASLHCATRP